MANFQVVRYKGAKHTFEVMTKPGTVLKWREGQLGLDNVLMSDVVSVCSMQNIELFLSAPRFSKTNRKASVLTRKT